MTSPDDDDPSLSDAELLDMPEQNLPAGILHRLRSRRDNARLRKATQDEYILQQRGQKTKAELDAGDASEYLLVFEQFQETMKDIRYREDLLLAQIEREEKLVRERLEDIDRRAIRLHDGRRAYVGSNRDYLDEHGTVLQGADEDEARRKHADNPNAATWDERASAKEQHEALLQMRKEIFEAREKRSVLDPKNLSVNEMKSITSEASASIARLETEFYEKFEAPRRETADLGRHSGSDPYGGDDYMASFDDTGSKGTLSMEFSPQARGQKHPTPPDKPEPGQGPSIPVVTGPA